ncbi:MAG: NAD(P)H-hydrate dehydratase [Verrucomicrobiae bacterium]|nr:NAD(P)H-hydrate dehydratase [Verrucomicrobiae bacterium]
MLVTCQEMRAIEDAVFARGVSADSLMERAGEGMALALRTWFPNPGRLIVVAGKGHNAGDGFVAARHLQSIGWQVSVRSPFVMHDMAALTRKKLEALGDKVVIDVLDAAAPEGSGQLVVMDGLLGIGATGALRDGIRDACRAVNHLRKETRGSTIAIDIPTGVDGDTGQVDPNAVVADFTFTVGAAKCGLVADHATNNVGRIVVIPVRELEPKDDGTSARVADANHVRSLLPLRDFETHKGRAGRVGIIAGSVGLSGAARLSATAALRAGAGLVTLFVPTAIWSQLAVSCPPEIMVRPMDSASTLDGFQLDAAGIGPGLGPDVPEEWLELVLVSPVPMVVDADALNAIARRGVDCLEQVTAPRLLTPHPGEMERLQPACGRTRVEQATAFTQRYPVTLLLKGARSLVTAGSTPVSFNTSGGPGMGSGGMGDALTGICTALIAQGLSAHNAGVAGSWLLGRAAEIAISHGGESVESLTASAVIQHLGCAFKSLATR